MRARIAGLTGWSNTRDRTERARGAYETRRANLAERLDPDGAMRPDERAAAVDSAIKAQMARAAFARSRKAARR
ncbi:hypothetical protein CryarDRAFT_1091 [Cryptosporangium arvum DSM 44712]|uniref:Uncharacterized protein n=2 Tax=Cryptosporangium TaxID=65502 RepID=A0A010ZS39_9ACTN|nr:hypothetical protein CryarDRAFT_1091 [Cryptosporangium arvum DSM 44712]